MPALSTPIVPGKLRVLAVGVDAYENEALFPQLATRSNDARVVFDCFREVHQLGADKEALVLDGARSDLLEMVTHNPSKDIVDIYTSMPWPSLCAEVEKLQIRPRGGIAVPVPTDPEEPTTVRTPTSRNWPCLAPGANGEAIPALNAHDEGEVLTSVDTSVQDATRPDPEKLWDIRPLLKRVMVEAPGIELEIPWTSIR